MQKYIIPLIALVMPLICNANEKVMRKYGTYTFSSDKYDVTVKLEKPSKGRLVTTIIFDKDGRKATTGIGKGSSIPVQSKSWAVQFNPPHELWVYDGDKLLMLYERTPNGFKGSDSIVVPALFERAPADLKRLIFVQKEKKN